MMNALFCGSNGEFSFRACKLLVEKGVNVEYVLLSDPAASDAYVTLCKEINAKIIYSAKEEDFQPGQFDFLISFTYQRKLKACTIAAGKFAINFHPAPLPDYRGRGTNMFAIINGEKRWAVTCHYLDADIDTGEIIEQREFDIKEASLITGKELADYGWTICLDILSEIMDKVMHGIKIESRAQTGGGRYYSLKDLNSAKKVELADGGELIRRKINALWFPPYDGAYIEVDGEKFYLMTESIMKRVFSKLV